MKHWLRVYLLFLLLVLVAFCLWMEGRYTYTVHEFVDISDKKILKEMPDIAITPRDEELEAYVLALPEIQTLLDQVRADTNSQTPTAKLPLDNARALSDGYLPEGWELLRVDVMKAVVYVDCENSDGRRLLYSFFTEEGQTMNKVITVSKNGEVKTGYQNVGGEIEKIVSRRQWFAWVDMAFDN